MRDNGTSFSETMKKVVPMPNIILYINRFPANPLFNTMKKSIFPLFLAVVQMYASPQLFVKGRKGKSSLQRYLKPILISAVVFITLLMVLLLAASYDREENRIRGQY